MKTITLYFACSAIVQGVVCADGLLQKPPDGFEQLGANRRVITQDTGYTAVRGNFTLPKIRVPRIGDKSSLKQNPHRSSPSFYLGCSQEAFEDESSSGYIYKGAQVDAGLAYESKAIYKGVDNNGVEIYIRPGWGVFVRTKSEYTPQTEDVKDWTVNPAGDWRCGPDTMNEGVTDVSLTWSIYKRHWQQGGGYGGYLQVEANGADAPPLDKDFSDIKIRAKSAGTGGVNDYLILRATTGMRVKRVVCITQGRGGPGTGSPFLECPLPSGGFYQEDGSFLRECKFSDGQVSTQQPTSIGFTYYPTQWSYWGLSQTDVSDQRSSGTGYYPGGRDQTITTNHLRPPYLDPGVPFPVAVSNGPQSRPIFEFPSITSPSEWDANLSSRYKDETVNINLRSFIPVGGAYVVPGPGGGRYVSP